MSTVAVAGATGGVGNHVAAQRRGAGHAVIGFARRERAATRLAARGVSVKKLYLQHAALPELARAVSEVDAVAFAAGVRLNAPIAKLEAIGRDDASHLVDAKRTRSRLRPPRRCCGVR